MEGEECMTHMLPSGLDVSVALMNTRDLWSLKQDEACQNSSMDKGGPH